MEFFQQSSGSSDASGLDTKLNENSFLVDVRTPAEFAEGSVKGAVNIPLDILSSELSRFKNKDSIIVFCRSGSRSAMAKSILESSGFTKVVNGGSWQNVSRFVK